MADMGFMPQVEWILRHTTSRHQTLLFSATLDGATQGLIDRYQTDPVRHEVASRDVTVEEMEHRFLLVHEMDKVKVTAAIAATTQKTLVFVRTKRGADRLVQRLEAEGVDAAAIHGDLRQQLRERALADFMAGKLPVLVATDVAARGIHVDDIDDRDPLRPARGPQGLPPPLGPHRAGRRVRPGGHARALGPGARGAPAAEAHRCATSRSWRSSRTTPGWPTSSAGTRPARPSPPDRPVSAAGHVWPAYRRAVRSAWSDAGGDDEARAAVVASVTDLGCPGAWPATGRRVAVAAPPAELLGPDLPGLVLEALLDPSDRRQGRPSPHARGDRRRDRGPRGRRRRAYRRVRPGGGWRCVPARRTSGPPSAAGRRRRGGGGPLLGVRPRSAGRGGHPGRAPLGRRPGRRGQPVEEQVVVATGSSPAGGGHRSTW